MKIVLGELDYYFILNFLVGLVMLITGIFFDPIAQHLSWIHREGFNFGQILWCGFWGIYLLLTYFYQLYYGK